MVIPVTAVLAAAAPARAQMYDPSYPVCLQVYGINGGYVACGYTSMAQCQASASGRSAQCIINPFFTPQGPRRRPLLRPHHRR
ncbi:DUF3551 domain-containing protein [Bradyrhizobium sp. ARR65]|uniref:DUF3551 domain-containing protein n=1 Tax=Bradyrhizobium sp. ARR65 TaxID=1040989 RepID=UPI0005597CAC|nr:DUF3551 domain-containing protein [Bradyrhizobium sp. ARR65]